VYIIFQCDVQLPLVVPILYFLIVTLIVAVPLVTKPEESAIGLAMMLGTGVAYYLLVIAWTSKPAVLVNKMGTSRSIHCLRALSIGGPITDCTLWSVRLSFACP